MQVREVAAQPVKTAATETTPINAQRNGASATMTNLLHFAQSLAEAEKPQPLPPGEYTAEIRGAENKVSDRTGNDYISLTMHVSADEYPADYTDGDPDGTILSYNRLSPKATPRNRYALRQFIEAVGMVPGTELDLNDLLGKAVTVRVRVTKYEGDDRSEISAIIFNAG